MHADTEPRLRSAPPGALLAPARSTRAAPTRALVRVGRRHEVRTRRGRGGRLHGAGRGEGTATRTAVCHDQAVVNLAEIARRMDIRLTKIAAWIDTLLPKIARRVNPLVDLVVGLVVGVLVLSVSIETYRDGGSVGWLIAGSALLLINLWGAWRRFSRLRKRATSP